MSALSLVLLVVFNFALAVALAWGYWSFKERLQRQDQKISESLDDLDLVEFQETVTGLLNELHRVGDSLVKQAHEKERSLHDLVAKATETQQELKKNMDLFRSQLDSLEKRMGDLSVKEQDLRNKAFKNENKVEQSDLVERADSKRAKPALLGSLPWPQSSAAKPFDEGQEAFKDKNAQYRAVYDLAEQGLSSEQIAKRTKLLRGEIDLILSLRPISSLEHGGASREA